MPVKPSIIAICEVPQQSALPPEFVDKAYFRDAYSVSLARENLSVVDIFFALFAHRPAWMKLAMVARNVLVAPFGIAVSSKFEYMQPQIKRIYRVGEKIGGWPIFALSDRELIAGRDNTHLDFRLSILRVSEGDAERVVVSTVCVVHNVFGKVYLFVITPFHQWGICWLMRAAIHAGRL